MDRSRTDGKPWQAHPAQKHAQHVSQGQSHCSLLWRHHDSLKTRSLQWFFHICAPQHLPRHCRTSAHSSQLCIELWSQHVSAVLVQDQTAASLRQAIVQSVAPLVNITGAEIRVDAAPAFQYLEKTQLSDPVFKALSIKIVFFCTFSYL